MMTLPSPTREETQTVLELAADQYNRYPGERVTLFVHYRVPNLAGATLALLIPRVMQVEDISFEGMNVPPSTISEKDDELVLSIPLDADFKAGVAYEFQVRTRVDTFYADQYLLVEACLLSKTEGTLKSASLRLAVLGNGQYLKYLPELYNGDDFLSRFLMLFESFWKPINQQIELVDNYFDPDLTPSEFLPWLASWLGFPVDDSLPLDRQRALLKSALPLFQKRGTRQALQTYLEIYTSGKATIIEHYSANFVLRDASLLGSDIAFGTDNRPNLIQILLRVPKSELSRTNYTPEIYHQKVTEIVRTLIPAHADFNVRCKFES